MGVVEVRASFLSIRLCQKRFLGKEAGNNFSGCRIYVVIAMYI